MEPIGRPPGGLSAAEAAERLRLDGPNELPRPARRAAWKSLAAQMVHFFALLLWVAGILAAIAGMPQLAVAIFVVVLVNGVFAFVQEHRAERAAERLRDLLPARVRVRRGGEVSEIEARDLVVGDLVLLASGDRVCADLRVRTANAMSLDTSTLTGESVPVPLADGDPAPAGTFVTTGEGEADVIAIGAGTRLASIAALTTGGSAPKSPLAIELDHVVRIVGILAVAVGTLFFGLALLIGIPASDGFLFGVGVTVALVPEGLLPTVTLSLAIGAQRMAARNALVRRLEAVETLGSTTFICTDKTGTLTRNEMTVVALWTPEGGCDVPASGYDPTVAWKPPAGIEPFIASLLSSAQRCGDGTAVLRDQRWTAQGDPMEAALDVVARRTGLVAASEVAADPTRQRFPFDASRRRMSVLTGTWLHVKGAPEQVLSVCLDRPLTAQAAEVVEDFARRGLRVLAVARRPADQIDPASPAVAVERDLELLGLIGLADPPREHVPAALAACRAAGISIGMITGDHPATAESIARAIGLWLPGAPVIDATTLPVDDAALGDLVDHDGVVISRVTPEDKLRIARALRARGHVVAMTGDGVNDGPALREADIGVAMGRSGTDVAREAADLVLLDDDFATIVAAVEQGRATYANIRRFLTYHLTDNVAELAPFAVWALSAGRIPLAIGVLQILCLDIGTDLLPALALGAEPPAAVALAEPPQGHLLDRHVLVRVFAILGPVEALVEMVAFFAVFLAAGWRPGDSFPTGHTLAAASGAAFCAVVLGQFANAFACRSTTRSPWRLKPRTNRFLVIAVAVELGALAAFIGVRPIADLLDQAPPPLLGFAVAALAIPAVLGADALHKRAVAARPPPAPRRDGRHFVIGPVPPTERARR